MAANGHFPYKYSLPCHLFFHTTKSTTTPLPPRKQSSQRSRAEHSAAVADHHETAASDRSYVMSRGGKGGRGAGGLDLKLHLSPPAPASSDEEWCLSSPSSCLSSEGEREREPQQSHTHGLQWSDSPEATSMVLAACPRCLMYVMLSEADPRCPRCRSPVLLDFLHRAAPARSSTSRRSINVSGREDGDDDHSRNNSSRGGGGGGGRSRRA